MLLASKAQCNLLRLIAQKLKIPIDEFRARTKQDGAGDIELSVFQELEKEWKAQAIAAGVWKEREPELKFQNLAHRKASFPTDKQLRTIDALWSNVSYMDGEKDRDKALKIFLNKRFKILSIENLKADEVPKVLAALEAMAKQPAMKFGGGT